MARFPKQSNVTLRNKQLDYAIQPLVKTRGLLADFLINMRSVRYASELFYYNARVGAIVCVVRTEVGYAFDN